MSGPGVEQGPDRVAPPGVEQAHHLDHAGVLADHMTSPAPPHVVAEPSEGGIHLLRVNIAQRCNTELFGGQVALSAAVRICRVAKNVLHARVQDQQRQAHMREVEGYLAHLERAGIEQQGMAGPAAQRAPSGP